ncbi:asparaginase [Acholeplasma equirhinis]|nr:asparaginase [Acholeplasma equirhinis]
MFNIAKLVDSEIKHTNYDGIVITHGTDTIEETAYFLDLYYKMETPIVMTGAMRNLSELGYDGLSNIVSAILVASDSQSKNRGVLLVMNDEINAASEVTKTHTVALDTFKSLEFGPLGVVDSSRVFFYRSNTNTKPKITISKLTKRVEIVKAASGTDSSIINFLIDSKVDGIIIEALGRGNVPPMMVPGIARAIQEGIPVVVTSRCPKGRVFDTYAYQGGGYHLKQLGVLFSGNLPSQKSRILLMLALESISTNDELNQYFEN